MSQTKNKGGVCKHPLVSSCLFSRFKGADDREKEYGYEATSQTIVIQVHATMKDADVGSQRKVEKARQYAPFPSMHFADGG